MNKVDAAIEAIVDEQSQFCAWWTGAISEGKGQYRKGKVAPAQLMLADDADAETQVGT